MPYTVTKTEDGRLMISPTPPGGEQVYETESQANEAAYQLNLENPDKPPPPRI